MQNVRERKVCDDVRPKAKRRTNRPGANVDASCPVIARGGSAVDLPLGADDYIEGLEGRGEHIDVRPVDAAGARR